MSGSAIINIMAPCCAPPSTATAVLKIPESSWYTAAELAGYSAVGKRGEIILVLDSGGVNVPALSNNVEWVAFTGDPL